MRGLAGQHRRACVDTADLLVDVALVHRPSSGGRVRGSAGGPSLAPKMVGGDLPLGFVEDCYDFAPTAYGAMAGDILDLQTLDWHGNDGVGDVVCGGLAGVVVTNVRRQPCGQESLEVGAVVGIGARFAANH